MVLYELRPHFDAPYVMSVVGGLGLLTALVWTGWSGLRRRGRETGRADRGLLAFTVFFLLLEMAAAYGFVIRPVLDYWMVRDAYENGRTLTAEGPVEDFTLRQDFWEYFEVFTINGVEFASGPKTFDSGLPGYPMRFWFKRGGGLIREGQRLRVQYVPIPGRSGSGMVYHCIVLIEELSQ